ncbi:hypothetical protein SDC9_187617 [bioreactor metagenome]|uniref:Uncharacterized protein n=1 Tax=bioreactor metagenome TaxID=1076179 RepID=A0A645HNQ1_9ZZZZ
MHPLFAYLAQANLHNWIPHDKGYAAFLKQIQCGIRKPDGTLQWPLGGKA